MSEQITSAMLDELERLIAATDPTLYDKWTRGEQLEAHGAYYRRSLELMPALIAAARRAERYETALRGMYDEARSAAKDLDASPDLHEWAAYLRDHIHALLWGSSPPEPPQSRPSGAHSPEAGGGV